MASPNPISQAQPVRVIPRSELATSRVESISPCFGREGMEQQSAGIGITRHGQLRRHLIVLPGLFLRPCCLSRSQRLEMKNTARRDVTAVAASVSWAFP